MDTIAILLATYNGEQFIEEQLKSLLQQTKQDFVCYIHDDGSTDRTLQIIQTFTYKYPEKFCLLRYKKTGSAKNNFFSMLENVDAHYYMFCDQDDIWLSEKIQVTFEEMKKIEEKDIPCAIFSDLRVVSKDLDIISPSFMEYTHRNPYETSVKNLLIRNVAVGCTMMINKKLRDMVCSYTNLDNIYMHDWWAILIASAIGKIGYIEKTHILYRQHENNLVGASKHNLRWLINEVKTIFSGQEIQKSKEVILKKRDMAFELDMLPEVNKSENKFLHEFSSIGNEPKLKRIRFYLKYNLLKLNFTNFWKILLV